MQYQCSTAAKNYLSNQFTQYSSISTSFFISLSPIQEKKSINSSTKSNCPLLLNLAYGLSLSDFRRESGVYAMFFHNATSPSSIFNIHRKESMSKDKIIELDIGENFNISGSTSMKVLSIRDGDTVRLAFNAPKHVKIYTESMYRKLLKEFSMNQYGDDESC